jgi:signal transduction histidine kinase
LTKGLSLKTRLTLWSLVLLALILSGGGFFCYYDQDRQAHEQLAAELISTARAINHLFGGLDPATVPPAGFCLPVDRLSDALAEKLAISLYSLPGELLCGNSHPLRGSLLLLPAQQEESLAGRYLFTTARDETGEAVRILTAPVVRQGRTVMHLQLGSSLLPIEAQQERLVLLLGTAGALMLVIFGGCQWLLIGILTGHLARFSNHLDNTRGEHLQPYRFSPQVGQEFSKLFRSYNDLAERISRTLQRTRQYSAEVTHELRTPLTILKGETELALRNNKDREQLLQVLSSNLEDISRMNHLIDDLLLLSKSELGEVSLKMEALNLSSLLLELYGQAQILAEEKQIRVEINGIDEPVNLFADGQRLRQVFLNLLSNAIKYTPAGGRVTLDCRLQGDKVEVTVADTGIGIESQHLAYIFDRFYRVEKTHNANDGGSGLGLAIAKWIVDAHKGRLRVSSMPGQGSSFAVLLPLSTPGGGDSD